MSDLDTIPLDPSRLPSARPDPQPPEPFVLTFGGGTNAARAANDAPQVRFGAEEVVDADGRLVAHELLFRWNTAEQPDRLVPGEFRVAAMLSNALLDGSVSGRTPSGLHLIAMDEPTLLGPLADLCTRLGVVITLTDAVSVEASVLLRVAQLRARGQRFCIDGLRDPADPRWLFAPYAEFCRLDLRAIRPDWLRPLAQLAAKRELTVIGQHVETMNGYQSLAGAGVPLFQGSFISPTQRLAVDALPGCDAGVLARLQQLLADRASAEALAVAAMGDPAVIMRLLLLHRLHAGRGAPEAPSVAALIGALPADALAGWLRVLLLAACHGMGEGWAPSVRQRVDRYRRGLRSPGLDDARNALAIDESLWIFLRRLCHPRHYVKTLRHPA